MKRLAHSTASALDFTSKTANPPITSLASEKGPSVTVSLPPVSRSRAPAALGMRPPVSTNTPALVASSPSLSIASISAFGGGPSGEFSVVLTMFMNRIVLVSYWFTSLSERVADRVSILPTTGPRRDRHEAGVFFHVAGTRSNFAAEGGPLSCPARSQCLRRGSAPRRARHLPGRNVEPVPDVDRSDREDEGRQRR